MENLVKSPHCSSRLFGCLKAGTKGYLSWGGPAAQPLCKSITRIKWKVITLETQFHNLIDCNDCSEWFWWGLFYFEKMSNEASEYLIRKAVQYKSLFPFLHIFKKATWTHWKWFLPVKLALGRSVKWIVVLWKCQTQKWKCLQGVPKS